MGHETLREAPTDAEATASVQETIAALRRHPMALLDVIETIPAPLLVLDGDKRIVAANAAARAFTSSGDGAPLAGLRPGEALGCTRARSAPDTCTLSRDCAECGAYQTLIAALAQEEASGEWRVTFVAGDTLESRELAIRLRRLNGVLSEPLWIAALQDIGEQKRKDGLQRLFFHDVLNVAGGIRGLTQLLPEMPAADHPECLALLDRLAMQLNDIIGGHRDLMWAEKGDLQAYPEPMDLRTSLADLVALYAHHPVAEKHALVLDAAVPALTIVTDGRILARVLGNLLKNGLEACATGETVTLRASVIADRCAISVHNPGVIDPDAQRQIFQRSFSTKSRGRGLGTYSARLLTERCLAGTVTLRSLPEEGTTFTVSIPLTL